MKKSKLAFAVLATTIFVASSSALVACGKSRLSDEDDSTFTITFDANGGMLTTGVTTTTLTTGTDGKLTELPTATNGTYTFNGWYTAQAGGTKISLDFTFNAATTVYAQWGDAPFVPGDTTYVITFNAGDGVFANGSKTYQASTDTSGKIPVYNDITDPLKDNCEFLGWTLDGTTIADVYSYTFSDNAVLYATYTEEELSDFLCLVNDNEKKINMTLYTQPDINGDPRAYEYQIGDPGVALNAGDIITFSIIDEHSADNTDVSGDLEFFVSKTGNGVEAESTSEKVTSVKILHDANYQIYLKWYDADDEGGNCFVLDISDKSGTGVTVPGEIVEDAPEVAFTLSDGSEINLKSVVVEAPDTALYQYTSVQGSVTLTKGEVITVTIEGNAPPAGRFGMRDSSHGIEIEGNKIKVLADGYFSLYLRYYEATAKDDEWWEVEMSDGKTDTLTDGAYYIVGGMNGWAAKEAYELVDGTITVDLTAGVEFKVASYYEEKPADVAASDYKNGITWGAGKYSFGWYQVTDESQEYIEDTSETTDKNIKVLTTGKYTITVVGTAPGAQISIEPFGTVATEPEHTITVDAGDGTYNGAETLTTNDKGRLTALPSDPTPPTDMVFVGWYTEQTGGTKITLSTKFTADVTIYARYQDANEVSANVIMSGNAVVTELKSTPVGGSDSAEAQYSATGLALTKDQKISFNLEVDDATGTTGGKPVKFVVDEYSKGVIVQGIYTTGTIYTEVTIAVTGTYAVYLKHYETDGEQWVLYIETTAAGAAAVTGTEKPSTNRVDVDEVGACYMVGKFGGEESWTQGIKMTPQTNQWTFKYTFEVGDLIRFDEVVSATDIYKHDTVQDNCKDHYNKTFKQVTKDGVTYLEVQTAGTYTFYVKSSSNSDHPNEIWIA